MKRTDVGSYERSTVGGEVVQAFVPENEATKKREMNALLKTTRELRLKGDIKLLILTQDRSGSIEEGGVLISVVDVLEWLCQVA